MVLSRYSKKKASPVPRARPTIMERRRLSFFFGFIGELGVSALSITLIFPVLISSVSDVSLNRLIKSSYMCLELSAWRWSTPYCTAFLFIERLSVFCLARAFFRDTGISSVLVGSSELNDVVVKTGIANLDMIPSGPIPPNPSEILGSKKMEYLVEALRKKYTRIIIDSPPLTAVTDSALLSKTADGTILVIRAGETPRQVVQNGLSQLHGIGGSHILGAVLNGVITGKDSYYYYQYYYYYYGDDCQREKKNKKKKRGKSAY